ncbi:hypothetical protein RJ640_026876 [Escallonia rubra]|uniref:KIB1-4 beta-propeller domain-containing protein n=1 Tax=Escallonia rubra TaxID=112253 RepID=A0AA88R2S3_9ASTE|nr:hypothetical protein RJ640_026876 [Escallonia rubra]
MSPSSGQSHPHPWPNGLNSHTSSWTSLPNTSHRKPTISSSDPSALRGGPPSSQALPRFPIIPNNGISESTWGFYLSKRTIFRLGLPHPRSETPPSSDVWLVKLERDLPNKMHLLNPLTRSELKPLPDNFPKSIDLLNLHITELGQEYTLQYINYRPFASSIGDAGTLYMEKVAYISGVGNDGFLLLTIHVSGKLAMLKYGEKKWTVIEDLQSPYDDVLSYDGEFYAVDNTGRTVVVNVRGPVSVNVIASSVFGGDKKFLVESCGELYMVDMYLSVGPEDDLGYNENFEFYEEFDCYMSERTVKFKVFKLDKSGQKWVEVESLGDRMLFLGDNCTFSASSSDFPACRGNCIFFTDLFSYSSRDEDGETKTKGIGVFDLETGVIGPLSNYPRYSELFWPPPSWIPSASTMVEVSAVFTSLSPHP